jgi:hypothetical protein
MEATHVPGRLQGMSGMPGSTQSKSTLTATIMSGFRLHLKTRRRWSGCRSKKLSNQVVRSLLQCR